MSSARAIDALQRTIILAATVSLGTIGIAVPIAWLTTRNRPPRPSPGASVLLALPLAHTRPTSSASTLALFLGPRGILQGWLEPLGVERLPEIYGFWGAWLALTLFTYPYVLLPVRSALLSLDRSFEEAARSLGRSLRSSTFFRVVLSAAPPGQSSPARSSWPSIPCADFGAVSLMDFGSLSRQVYVQVPRHLRSVKPRPPSASSSSIVARQRSSPRWKPSPAAAPATTASPSPGSPGRRPSVAGSGSHCATAPPAGRPRRRARHSRSASSLHRVGVGLCAR
ncbi:MAG: hypothetical protein U5Q44_15340 [Dehalococcoidia bacterium]|nr:hypothetical protein [Dehalococcoidia bacterium]